MKRVLVVDDSEMVTEVLCEVLQSAGHQVTTAGDGTEALALVDETRFDVAILDIGLPGIDGFELAARLRDKLRAATPYLIAFTGYGEQSDHDRGMVAGFDVVVTKPFNIGSLLAIVAGGATPV